MPTFLGGRVTVNGVEKIVPIDEAKGLELIDPKTGKPTDQPIVIPGEGTYTVNNGMVEFKPEPQFTGKGTGVEVQRVDENGTPVKLNTLQLLNQQLQQVRMLLQQMFRVQLNQEHQHLKVEKSKLMVLRKLLKLMKQSNQRLMMVQKRRQFQVKVHILLMKLEK